MADFEQFKQWRQEADQQFERWVKTHADDIPPGAYSLMQRMFAQGFMRAKNLDYIDHETERFGKQLEDLDGPDS